MFCLSIIRCIGSSLCCANCSRILPNVWSITWSYHCYICYLFTCVSLFFPIPSHSCDPLEDLFPSLSQHGSVSVFPDDEDLEFWQSYLRIHLHFCEFLFFSYRLSPIGWQSVESYPFLTSITYIHMAWIVLVLWDCLQIP